MFRLTNEPITPPEFDEQSAGGFVSFEGKVRSHNEGRSVIRLEYEAFGPLAETEGSKLLEEATKMFGLLRAETIHRTGMLELGETAVWIGVAAPHRKEAFNACEYIIDELKKRVPIWKKEHYAEGDSGWIGITEQNAVTERYRRQVNVPEMGEEGQRRLADARVLVVGAGGLGCAALPYLAAAGVGTIGVCDGDAVEESNLHRQILYGPADQGYGKARVATAALRRMNPSIKVCEHSERLSSSNVADLVRDYDLIIDGTDNFATKFLLNDACCAAGKPLIVASLHRFEGQLCVVVPGSNGGCLRCMWPEAPYDGCVGTCAEDGILGVVPGAFGVLQANEAIKLIIGMPSPLTDHLLLFDLRDYTTLQVSRTRRDSCPGCEGRQAENSIDLDWRTAQELNLAGIDIREPWEGPTPVHLRSVPMDSVRSELTPEMRVILVCQRGQRSSALARELRAEGYSQVYSLLGGVAAVGPRPTE